MIDIARETLLSVADVARKLGVTRKAVYDWINRSATHPNKHLESVRVGGKVLTSENALRRFAQQSDDEQGSEQPERYPNLSHEEVARQLLEEHGIDIETGKSVRKTVAKAVGKKGKVPHVHK